MNLLDRAESRLGHLAIPRLVNVIAFLSAFVFILYKVNPNFFAVIDLDPRLIMAGQVWRLVTYIFIPSVNWFFMPDYVAAVFYVLFLIWMGNGLEDALGAFRLNVYCLITMLGVTVAAFFFGQNFSNMMLVQALFFAFARFYPDTEIYVMFILPMKVKWLAWMDAAALIFFFIVSNDNSFRVSLIAAMAAYFLFFGREIFQAARHRQDVTGRRRRFENAVRKPDEEAMHHCVICKRTEIQAPELEFRVARDGQEYCLEHLPKASVPPTAPQ